MKAIQLVSHGTPGELKFLDLPDPVPGPGDVLVRIHACGLNRLDLWMEEGSVPGSPALPRIPGGEVSGEVAALGSGVTQWHAGDRVAIQSNLFCGQCEFCARGEESLCLKGLLLGVHRDGGFAEMTVVPERALVRLPGGVDYESSAALTLAGSTAMHMLTYRAPVKAGDWVLVMGASSGVGSAGIQIAKHLGARVITTASNPAKRELGLKIGAEFVVDSNAPDWPAEVRKITGKRGVDLVLEHVGGEVLAKCFDCLARGGSIVTCGATAGREVPLKLWPIFVKEQKLVGSYGRRRVDIAATLDWAAQGKLKPVIAEVVPLAETRRAYDTLRRREVLGKLVVSVP